MNAELFIAALGLGLLALLTWAFRTLPRERWQIFAAVPAHRHPSGWWSGVNLTYYGLFLASAYLLALVLFLVLAGALGVPLPAILTLALILLAAGVPAAKWVARRVEGKKHTLTFAGASFVGLWLAPIAVQVTDLGGLVIPLVAALAIAGTIGEGVGRLACISFGCCYGKPLGALGPPLRRIFSGLTFTFHGKTRKIAYASGLEGVPVVPIQALTAGVLSTLGLAATWLFLDGRFVAALALAVIGGNSWRLVSERLRADHRGGGKLSAYQWMSLLALGYPAALVAFAPAAPPAHLDLAAGLVSLWDPGLILLLQLLWLGLFLWTGRSMVTGALMAFHVHADRI